MRLISPPGVGLAPLRGRLSFPGHSVTLIAKVKLQLTHAGVASLCVEEPCLPSGDEPYPDDETGQGAPRYESDYAFHKPAADVLVVGHFHAPGAKPVKASEVAVGIQNRVLRLSVVGRRRWVGVGRLPDANQAEPFAQLPLRWEFAYGGPGHQQNPVGTGYVPPESLVKGATQPRDFGRQPLELPRIERPDKPLAFLDQPLDPVCFAPRARVWPVRRNLIGKCDERWLKTRWPWFPEDFDAHYFQAALPGLQQREYLRGDETLRFKNMHPNIPEYQTQLPGLCALAAVQRKDAQGGLKTEPVSMHLDTLWVDMDTQVAHLVWRGACATQDADASDIVYAWVGLEAMHTEVAPSAVVERAEQGIAAEEAQWAIEPEAEPAPEPPPAPPAPEPEPALDPELLALLASLPKLPEQPLPVLSAEQKAQFDDAAKKAEAELDARLAADDAESEKQKPPPWTRERVRATRAAKGKLSGLDLSGLDLSGEDLSDTDLTGTLFTGACLDKAVLRGSLLVGASLQSASLTETNLCGAKLDDADLSQTRGARMQLEGAQLPRANLAACEWEGVQFREVNLELVHAQGARFVQVSFAGSKLDEADFSGAQLEGASFDSVSAEGASFGKAQLASTKWSDCKLQQIDYAGALLTSAHFSRCNLDDAVFEQASASGSVFGDCSVARLRSEAANFSFAQWTQLTGKDAVFEAAQFTDARLSQCSLVGADFTGGKFMRAALNGCTLKRAKFGKADLSEAMLLGCDCFEATFEAARLAKCDGGGTSFFRAEFLDAEVGDFYGRDRDLLGTKLAPVG